MAIDALRHYPTRDELPRWLIAGFLAGALSVLIFHQATIAVLAAMEVIKSAPYSTAPTSPWGVPQIWSTVFWGGVWGVLLAAVLGRMATGRLLVAALIFGAVLPTLVGWFVVAPLKGQPMAAGFVPSRMWLGPVINGVWGLGTGIGLALARRLFQRGA